MKCAGKISVILAGIILLMHSFLPHKHTNELSAGQHIEAHESASSLLDFIRLAFHFNPGENHLEEFQVSKQYQKVCDHYLTAEFVICVDTPLLSDETPNVPHVQSVFTTRYFQQNLSFRGPPALG